MKRQGDVVIRFPNRANPDQRLVSRGDFAVVTLLIKKFDNMFKKEFIGKGLVLKGEWAKAGTLRLRDIESDNRWLRLGWEMTGEGASPAVAAGGE